MNKKQKSETNSRRLWIHPSVVKALQGEIGWVSLEQNERGVFVDGLKVTIERSKHTEVWQKKKES
jgi:hypothetical protein